MAILKCFYTNIIIIVKKIQKLGSPTDNGILEVGGDKRVGAGFEKYAKYIVIAKPSTKFEHTCSKHLEVIQS